MDKLRILTKRLNDLEEQMKHFIHILHGPQGSLQDQVSTFIATLDFLENVI